MFATPRMTLHSARGRKEKKRSAKTSEGHEVASAIHWFSYHKNNTFSKQDQNVSLWPQWVITWKMKIRAPIKMVAVVGVHATHASIITGISRLPIPGNIPRLPERPKWNSEPDQHAKFRRGRNHVRANGIPEDRVHSGWCCDETHTRNKNFDHRMEKMKEKTRHIE